MEAVLTGAAANTISGVLGVAIAPLTQLIDDVIHLDRNTQLLEAQLNRMKNLVLDITNRFQHDQRSPPNTVKDWLQRLHHSLQDARRVMDRAQQHKQCLDCFLCKPRLSTQVREWNANFDRLYIDLERDLSIIGNAERTASSAPLQSEAMLQPVPELGFVGSGIKSGKMQLQRWLDNEDQQFRRIGVYGMGGIGKTSLLKTVYNAYKKGKLFEAVIWTSVSQIYNIADLQSNIAEEINLKLGSTTSNPESSSAADMRKRKLSACLREKKFLLILDDVWTALPLEEELGIPVGNDKGSRVVISTRSFDVVRRMEADDFSIEIQPLSRDEGWRLFCRGAFKADTVPTKDIEDVATRIAGECNGFPLAINVVAAAMKSNTSVNDWTLAFNQMKNMDPGFLEYSSIAQGLYQPLKLSYDCLPDSNFKICFLYCATFPENRRIYVNALVEKWIAEGLVNSRETSYLMDTGLRYVQLLVERCLFQKVYDENGVEYLRVHDVVHDLAMYIGEKEEQCLFRTRQNLQKFPAEKEIGNCKRIAIGYNNISVLPTEFICPNLLTLTLQYNQSLREVPNGFLVNLTSLRVLDLSGTKIESLPISLWHLRQLEFLGLEETLIKDVPEDICNLSQLQFLHLNQCRHLESLPCKIGELQNLKTLDLTKCCSLTGIPREISQLTSLNRLHLWTSWTAGEKSIMDADEVKSGVCSLKDLTNCPNLLELSVHVKAGIEEGGIRLGIQVGIMGTWLEMRDLILVFDVQDDDVVEDLPQDMQSMKKLHRFLLLNYHGRSLPNCICEFPQLQKLYLYRCFQLGELPPLERLPNLRSLTLDRCINLKELGIGKWGSASGFPMLESLNLIDLPKLESMASSSSNVEWNEQTMPKLQVLSLTDCASLKGLPMGIEKLPNLREIKVQKDRWEELIWEENDVEIFLKEKLHHLIVFVE
uniref:AAA+ ATPase domain-containing protein n=1 Tax=Picea sitchensis TaxID=3332 RepID=B8LS43_PICSI|nr:unknown [Picea sitchensis]